MFDAINDDQPSWEKLNIKGIELYLFIEYDETDNLSNIQTGGYYPRSFEDKRGPNKGKSHLDLYWRVSDIAFVEVQNLYKYIEGHMPFSTQHKIKGLEFKNVLIVLHNGGWNNYNFEYLFNRNVDAMLTPAQKRSYPNILRRTQKLFYVCCTRAKDNLVVYYPSPSDEVLEGAVSLFGRDNCIDLDAE